MSVLRKPPPVLVAALEDARQRFVQKFGREPGPGDPIVFDEDADTPQPADPKKLELEMLAAMLAAGTPAHLIFAFRKTGLIVTKGSYRRLSRRNKRAWDAAMAEWAELQEEAERSPQ